MFLSATDGTHIRLECMLDGDNDYINRKGFTSIQLQLVANDLTDVWGNFFGGLAPLMMPVYFGIHLCFSCWVIQPRK